MSDLLINWFGNLKTVLPWVSFIAGVGGSLHCVGMCGGLVTATCQKSGDVGRYQVGRLMGYLILGFFAGVLGKIFTIQTANPKLTLIPGLIIGGLFLFWGIQNYRGKKAEVPVPKFFTKIHTRLWTALISKNKGLSKSFFIGFLSIFLPCGLLYGVVLGVAAFEHSWAALYAMFFFWLGTVPSMMLAPSIIQKFLRPLKAKLPKTYAISLIVIGLMTIGMRLNHFHGIHREPTNSNHSTDLKKSCH